MESGEKDQDPISLKSWNRREKSSLGNRREKSSLGKSSSF